MRALGRNIFYLLRGLIKRLPYAVFRIFSYVFVFVGHCVMFKKRKIAIDNLEIAFGREKDQREIKKIARDCFDNFGRGMIDLIYFIDRPHEIIEKVSIEGKEHLEKVLEAKKGAVIVSAHFGNFILMYLRTILEGYKINVIMRRTRDKKFEKYISDFRRERGIKTIYDLPARRCVQESLKALRNNELLFILLDQNYGSEGRVFVDFFGEKAATATGPVVFSNRTGAAIVPMFIMGDHNDRHKLIIEPPLALEKSQDEQQQLVSTVAQITKVIEKHVRQRPFEWGGWMHKRWKSRTVEEQAMIDQLKDEGYKNHHLFLYND